MSTASTCSAPLRSAIATSDPDPAPMIRTSSRRIAGQPKIGRPVNSFALLQLPLRGGHHLVGHAVDADEEQVRARRVDFRGRDLVVRRPADAGSQRLLQQLADQHQRPGASHEPAGRGGQHQIEDERDEHPKPPTAPAESSAP